MEPMKVRLRQHFPPMPTPKGRDALQQHWPFTWWADYDEEGWTLSVHLVEKNDAIVVDEIRVKPAEAVESSDPTRVYEPDSIPGHGLNGTMIRNFRFTPLIKSAIHELTRPPDSDEGIDFLDWADDLKSGGFDYTKVSSYTQNRRRGRPPLAEEELARMAYYYVDAIKEQVKAPLAYVSMKRYGTDEYVELIRQRIVKCRQRGFLTPAPGNGIAGGHLTPKANEIIKRLGLEDRHGIGDRV